MADDDLSMVDYIRKITKELADACRIPLELLSAGPRLIFLNGRYMPDKTSHWKPSPDNEVPFDSLDRDNTVNWYRIPVEDRERCLEILREKTTLKMFLNWRDQYYRGMRIGSDDLHFHHGIGMQVRNALRAVVPDEKLPKVKYPDGEEYQNWDDFYMGALRELVSSGNDIKS